MLRARSARRFAAIWFHPFSAARVLRVGRASLCCLVLLFGGLSACDDPTPDELLQRAETHWRKGDYRASIIELKNALRKAPDNAQARLLLGRSYLELGDLAGAEKEILRAQQLGIGWETALVPLATIWLSQGRYEQVLEAIPAADDAAPAVKAAVLAAHGNAHHGLGHPDRAEREFRAALVADPRNLAAHLGLARLAMERADVSKAELAVEQASKLAPEDPDVIAVKADLDFLRGDYGSAQAGYQTYLKIRPDDISAGLARAQALLETGSFEQAVAQLDLILKRAPGHADANYLRASLALAQGDYVLAKRHGEKSLLSRPRHTPSLLVTGTASYGLGQYEQAYKYLDAVLAKEPFNDLARRLYVEARSKLDRISRNEAATMPLLDDSGDVRQVLQVFDPTARRLGDLEAGRAFLVEITTGRSDTPATGDRSGDGAAGTAVARLAAALKTAPSDTQTLVRLAVLDDRLVRSGEALSWATERLAADPDSMPVRALLGWLHLRDGHPKQSLAAVETALQRRSSDPTLLAIVGLAQLQMGQTPKAEGTFGSLAVLRSASAAARYLRALAYRDLRDDQGYQAQLDRVLSIDPTHREARVALGRLQARRGELEAASSLSQELLKDAPDNPEVLGLAGAIRLLQGRTSEAVDLFRRAADQAQTGASALMLAFAQHRAGDKVGSRATLERWLEHSPADVGVRLALGNKYLIAGELQLARYQYSRIVLLAPDELAALNNLAWVHLRLNESSAALPYAERAFELAPDDPKVVDTLGLALLASGKTERAVELLRRAAQKQPDNAEIQVHLARALVHAGSKTEARELLGNVLSKGGASQHRDEALSLLRELED